MYPIRLYYARWSTISALHILSISQKLLNYACKRCILLLVYWIDFRKHKLLSLQISMLLVNKTDRVMSLTWGGCVVRWGDWRGRWWNAEIGLRTTPHWGRVDAMSMVGVAERMDRAMGGREVEDATILLWGHRSRTWTSGVWVCIGMSTFHLASRVQHNVNPICPLIIDYEK